jgi:hypothetical protein
LYRRFGETQDLAIPDSRIKLPAAWLTPGMWLVIGLSALAFLVNRHAVRPWVLNNVDGGPATVMANSLPNFLEAIIGTIDIAIILLIIVRRSVWLDRRIGRTTIYVVATVLAGLFVVSCELNWIRFRGPNVYDSNDLVASILGLLMILFLLFRFGLIKEHSHG